MSELDKAAARRKGFGMRALSSKKTSAKDLAEIRKLLKSKQGGAE